jgi:DNA polymerase-3 subunit epsilon
MSILVFDTETTGIPSRELNHKLDHPDYPWPVSFAGILFGPDRQVIEEVHHLIQPGEGWAMQDGALAHHGITLERAAVEGIPLREALDHYARLREACTVIAGHHVSYDRQILRSALMRCPGGADFATGDAGKGRWTVHCTMKLTAGVLRDQGDKWKWIKLEEAYRHFFGEDMEGAHDAMNDVRACARILFHLADTGVITLPGVAAAAE